MRPVVYESWSRSKDFGVDPDLSAPPVELVADALRGYRDAHPLRRIMPVIRQLLVTHAADDAMVVAVSDAEGTLLWVEGDPGVRRRAEGMGFTEGARWDERHAGTNAPGLALTLDRGARVSATEHWAHPVRRWSCSASPLHDLTDGTLLGAVDVTGDDRAATDAVAALIGATVAAAERELVIQALRAGAAGAPRASGISAVSVVPVVPGGRHGIGSGLLLTVLRSDAPQLTVGGRRIPISLRHAELLLLLAEHPEGLSAQELAIELDERDLDAVTVRAELSRLRRVVGSDLLLSRPYRLAVDLATDVTHVRGLLAAGDHRGVVAAWNGQLLPRSAAPGVVALRERLRAETRVGLLRQGDAPALLRWAEGPAGADDLAVWEACRRLLPPGPQRDRATARVTLLHRDLGAG